MTKAHTEISPLDIYTELISYTLYLIGTPPLESDAEKAAVTMDVLLKRSQKRSSETLAWAQAQWLDGFFPIAAWIDECLQNPAWPGCRGWLKWSLQRRFFNSSIAGQEFFKRLEGLDESDTGVREIYDFCLALGFHGQFYENDSQDQQRLEEICQANLVKFCQDDPALEIPSELFPAGTATRLPKVRGAIWPRLRNWLCWLLPPCLIFLLYYLLSVRLVDLIPSR